MLSFVCQLDTSKSYLRRGNSRTEGDLRKREYILVYSSRGLRGHDGRVEAEGPAEDLLGGRSRKLGVPIINSKYRAERVPEVG